MADLTQTRKHGKSGASPQVIFVRQPIKSALGDDRNSTGVRLAIGVIVALGSLGAIWLIGCLGFHFGFAQSIGLPELALPAGGGLVAGVRTLAALPGAIMASALAEPAWLMVGVIVIAIPAASLAVIGPTPTPGGPRPHILTTVFSHTGAIAACAVALLLVWWSVLPFRADRLSAMPMETTGFVSWLRDLRIIVGLDALAATAGAFWAVLAMRLVIPRWLKGLSAAAMFTSLAIVTIAMSTSAGTLAQLNAPRSVVDTGEPALLLGKTDAQVVLLRVEDGKVQVTIAPPAAMAVTGRESIGGLGRVAQFIRREAARDFEAGAP